MVLKQFRNKKELMLSIGMLSLTLAILLERFGVHTPMINFLAGVFMGLSLTLNVGYLIRYSFENNSIVKSIKNSNKIK